MQYTGRFAPSPSGRLHFGSLVCAVGSYLRARSLGGRILLRIEDLDYYRCSAKYTDIIIRELHELGFEYDGEPYIQSEHQDIYLEVAKKLEDKALAYGCSCSRATLRSTGCICKREHFERKRGLSLRFPLSAYTADSFEDELLGKVSCPIRSKDLTLIRGDNVISYNLACVTDDILQGVTEVVRGSDLCDITTSQLCLYKALNTQPPHYLHLPLVMENETYKLSKQNRAQPVMTLASPSGLLIMALEFLNQDTRSYSESMKPAEILKKAAGDFTVQSIPKGPKLCPALWT